MNQNPENLESFWPLAMVSESSQRVVAALVTQINKAIFLCIPYLMGLMSIAYILAAPPAYGEDNVFKFRTHKWGQSKISVIAAEPLKPVYSSGPMISYKTTILGIETFLLYRFVKNKLYSAHYVISTSDTTDINNIKKYLQKKYGDPMPASGNKSKPAHFTWRPDHTVVELKSVKQGECRVEYLYLPLEKVKQSIIRASDKKEENDVLAVF